MDSGSDEESSSEWEVAEGDAAQELRELRGSLPEYQGRGSSISEEGTLELDDSEVFARAGGNWAYEYGSEEGESGAGSGAGGQDTASAMEFTGVATSVVSVDQALADIKHALGFYHEEYAGLRMREWQEREISRLLTRLDQHAAQGREGRETYSLQIVKESDLQIFANEIVCLHGCLCVFTNHL